MSFSASPSLPLSLSPFQLSLVHTFLSHSAFSSSADRYAGIGFVEAPIAAALSAGRQLLIRAEELLEEAQSVRLDYRDFFEFLLLSTFFHIHRKSTQLYF